MGIWLPRRNTNIELVREVREAWRRCSIRRGVGTVRIQHVRSHTGVPGNELADQLADAAAREACEEPDLSLSAAERLMDKIEAEGRGDGSLHASRKWGRTSRIPGRPRHFPPDRSCEMPVSRSER